jgi:D-3-phosphoglycerate dehydrogenase / 2-oxoglutarate reductase
VKPVVFVPERIAEAGLSLLSAECECVAPWVDGRKPSLAELKMMLTTADAVLVRLFEVRTDDLATAVRLKVIAKHGVGVDNIDVPAATARNIPVVFTPAANGNAVAEHTIALMFSMARNLCPASTALRNGRFTDRDKFEGTEIRHKTLGVLGLGRIGSRVAEIAHRGFEMNVVGYDPFVSKEQYAGVALVKESLDAVLREADFLTLHLPLTPETHRLIDAERLSLMKGGCRIINTSRGGVIDELALVQALREGHIASAALDVFEREPLPPDHPFQKIPNILLTPHISALTKEALERMACDAAQGILNVLQGRRPLHIVNPEVFQ